MGMITNAWLIVLNGALDTLRGGRGVLVSPRDCKLRIAKCKGQIVAFGLGIPEIAK
jgi:hypothetical protein